MHTDLEIQVPTVENLAQSNVLHLRPGVGRSVAMHASPFAIHDKLQSLCPLSLCPNYCLYAVTVGGADSGVADIVNILQLSLSSICSFCTLILHFFLMWLYVVDIKTQELTTFVFISPVSVHHPPPPPHTHTLLFPLCRLVLCINLHHR